MKHGNIEQEGMMYRNNNHPLKAKIYARYPSMDSFCQAACLDKTTVYKILRRGTKVPNGLTIYKISEALGLSYNQVIDLLREV